MTDHTIGAMDIYGQNRSTGNTKSTRQCGTLQQNTVSCWLKTLGFFFTKIPQIVVFERKYLFKSIIWGIHVKIPLHMTNCYKIQTQDLNTFEYNHFPVSNEMCPTQQKKQKPTTKEQSSTYIQ